MADDKLPPGNYKPGAKDWKDNKYGLEDGYRALEDREETAPLLGGGIVLVLLPVALVASAIAIGVMLWNWFH